jgi:hypothetical protein
MIKETRWQTCDRAGAFANRNSGKKRKKLPIHSYLFSIHPISLSFYNQQKYFRIKLEIGISILKKYHDRQETVWKT